MRKILIVISIMMMFCMGCSNSTINNTKEPNISNELENQKSSNTSDDNAVQTTLENTGTSKRNSIKKSDISKTLDSHQKYINFIKNKKEYNHNDKIMFFAKEDIDLDGNDEVIIASGVYDEDPISSYISQVYILRDDNGKVKQVGENLNGNGYTVYEVKLIRLQNSAKKYIYCGITNSSQLKGFEIIELTNNQPKIICYSASPTGAGDDEIKDFDNDGQIDGYVQNRWSYDVFYYSLRRIYKLTNYDFVLDNTYVEIPEYPDNPKDVIIQYLSLRALNEEKSIEVNKRLSELCIFDKANEFDFSLAPWYSAINDLIIVLDDNIKFDIKENGDAVEAVMKFTNNNKEYIRKFHLIKSDDKWSIDSIS